MSWKEKRLITILSIILAVLCAAVLVVLSIRYRAAGCQGSEHRFPVGHRRGSPE